MRDFVELRPDRGIDLGHAMAMHVAPQAADAIQIAAPITVDQVHPLRGGNDQRLTGLPQLHGRERMPDMHSVELAQVIGNGHEWRRKLDCKR